MTDHLQHINKPHAKQGKCLGCTVEQGGRMNPIPKPKKTSKNKKTKKKRLSRLKQLERDCFSLWGDCVKARDHVCRVTGSSERLTAHHIRSRTHHATRFNLENGITVAWKVHFLQKANPERFQDMIIEVIGQEEYDRLKRMSLVVVDQTVDDLEQIKFELEAKLKQIRAGVNFD